MLLDKQVIDRTISEYRNRWFCGKPKVFTYILKDVNSNHYKIGQTTDLRKRILTIRNSFYYDCLDYQLFAFTPCNIEEEVLRTIVLSGGKGVRAKSKTGASPREMFLLDEDSISAIIAAFSFQRVENGMIPVVNRNPEGTYQCLFFRYNVDSWVEPPTKRYNKKEDA